MADKPMTLTEVAVQYALNGFKVYPLVRMRKIPHSGSNGHLDATDEPEEVRKLFEKYDIHSNIGLNLMNTEYIILDIDLHHEGKSGFDSLQKIEEAYTQLPETFTVCTPRNGLHMYYRIPGLSLDRDLIDFRPGIDILGTKVNAALSVTDKGMYRVKSGKITEIAELPKFFIELMVQHDRQKQSNFQINYDYIPTGKKFTASFMEALLSGQQSGNRNAWITQQYGRMVALGMDFTAAYTWIQIVNQNFVQPPLSAGELNKIIKSIAKREQQKYESHKKEG